MNGMTLEAFTAQTIEESNSTIQFIGWTVEPKSEDWDVTMFAVFADGTKEAVGLNRIRQNGIKEAKALAETLGVEAKQI